MKDGDVEAAVKQEMEDEQTAVQEEQEHRDAEQSFAEQSNVAIKRATYGYNATVADFSSSWD